MTASGTIAVHPHRRRLGPDIAVKHDVVLLGHLRNGIGFYRFSYNGSNRAYVGVMAQDVQLVVVSLTIAALLCTAASVVNAQQAFKSPDEAASALVSAAKAGDPKA